MNICKAIAKLLFKLTGWSIVGKKPDCKKILYIGGPHTSNWDFVVALGASFILDIKAKIIVKKEVMFFPLNLIIKAIGAIPIDRHKVDKTVSNIDLICEEINKRETVSIVISPKGTRKKVNRVKTGFFYIARKSNIPICPCGLDFAKKQLIISEPYFLSDDLNAELNKLRKFYSDKTPKHPEKNIDYSSDLQ